MKIQNTVFLMSMKEKIQGLTEHTRRHCKVKSTEMFPRQGKDFAAISW